MLLEFEVRMRNQLWKVGEEVRRFVREEEGDTNVISIIVVLVIVLGLAIVFKDKIKELVDTLWNSVTDNANKATQW